MEEEILILVDDNDHEIGQLGKLETHQQGLLHRAVSVFIVDIYGNWLIQRRSDKKYHSKGLWTNACCTHPRPGENAHDAALRRLQEELNITCELNPVFTFIYNENVEPDLIENEFDHVFLGVCSQLPTANPEEVSDFQYLDFETLDADVSINPAKYTVWFRKLYSIVQPYIKDKTSIL